MDRLQQLLNNLPIIQSIHPEDASIILTDTKKIIGYLPGKTFDFKLQIGASLEQFKDGVTYEALTTGEVHIEERDDDGFGFAYISTATPILEDDQIIGVLSVLVLNNKVSALRSGVKELTSTGDELAKNARDIANITELISDKLKDLVDQSSLLRKDIRQIEEILSVIKDTAVKSRILGLNASIEAARSGEHGKGFAVVANEIKKMADNSKETVEGAVPQIKEMTENLETISGTIEQIAADSEEQSKILDEFKEAFQQIIKITSRLYDQSEM